MAERNDRFNWDDDDNYWRSNYRTRPYASSSSFDYDYYRPGYQFGYEAANRYQQHEWKDVESDLSKSWNTWEHKGNSTWEQMKDAVRDAWDRVTGRRHAHAR